MNAELLHASLRASAVTSVLTSVWPGATPPGGCSLPPAGAM